MKRILFIDRDGTLIKEVPPSYQVDSFEKVEFYPNVFEFMGRIAREFDYELVMVTNQDGLGTPSFPENTIQATNKQTKTRLRDILTKLANAQTNFQSFVSKYC